MAVTKAFGVRPDRSRPAAEALRRPLGIAAVRAGHVIGIGAVPTAAVAALMHGDPLAAMEQLDGAAGRADVDLLADQAVRHRVEEALDLDVIVDADAGEPPFGELVVLARQRCQRRALDGLEEVAAADAEPAHDMIVDAVEAPAIAALASASEKKVWRRSRPRMQVWAKRTPFSTLALSWGLRGRAGRTPTP